MLKKTLNQQFATVSKDTMYHLYRDLKDAGKLQDYDIDYTGLTPDELMNEMVLDWLGGVVCTVIAKATDEKTAEDFINTLYE